MSSVMTAVSRNTTAIAADTTAWCSRKDIKNNLNCNQIQAKFGRVSTYLVFGIL